MAVGVWPVVLGQGPFCLVGRSWVTWWRRLGVALAVQFPDLVVVVPVVQAVLWCVQSLDQVRAWRCRWCCTCGCGRRCAHAATWWSLAHSGSASDSSRRLRTFLLRQRLCPYSSNCAVFSWVRRDGVVAHHTGDEPISLRDCIA